MLKKLQSLKLPSKKYLTIGLVVILLIGGGLALNSKHTADKRKNDEAHKQIGGRDLVPKVKPITYTFNGSDVSCEQAKPTPNADTTINYCSGTASLTDSKTNKPTTYTVSSATYLYKNGKTLTLDQFSDVPANQQLSAVTFTGKDKKTLSTINYNQ